MRRCTSNELIIQIMPTRLDRNEKNQSKDNRTTQKTAGDNEKMYLYNELIIQTMSWK